MDSNGTGSAIVEVIKCIWGLIFAPLGLTAGILWILLALFTGKDDPHWGKKPR